MENYLGYTWPETNLGSSPTAPCPCVEILGSTLAGVVRRSCGGTYTQGAVWSDEVDSSNCATSKSDITARLCDAAMVTEMITISPCNIENQNGMQ